MTERVDAAAPIRAGGALDRRFEAVVFDWDGTAVTDRTSDATRLRELVESACALGLHLAIVSGTSLANVDGQLGARPQGPGTLHLLLDHGADAFRVASGGPRRLEHRAVAPEAMRRLETATRLTVVRLAERGLRGTRVIHRANRVKIDLIPLAAWRDPPKARIAELCAAVEDRLRHHGIDGLGEVVGIARAASVEAGLGDVRITTDAKHLELGVCDESDSARWMFARLWRHGVGPGLVLVAGDAFGPLGELPGSDSLLLVPAAARATAVSVGVEPTGIPDGVLAVGGGPSVFLEILEDQVARRRRGDPPRVDDDPAWTIVADGLDPELERVHESRLALGDGRIGTRGSVVVPHAAGNPSVLAAGLYHGLGAGSELLPAPLWNLVGGRLDAAAGVSRTLDLHTGVLHQSVQMRGELLDAVLFSSLARPGTAALRAETSDRSFAWSEPLAEPTGGGVPASRPESTTGMCAAGLPGGVAVAASQRIAVDTDRARLERLAAYRSDPRRRAPAGAASERLRAAEGVGFERLLDEHRARWAQRWEDAGIDIVGDPDLQLATRFALFHLIGSAGAGGEAAVGARGLTGPAYRGHVFWDADVFVLPFFAATHPAAARAMLEYRIRRLPAARAASRAEGGRGAHFPWESAARGDEVTPTSGRDRLGRFTAILTGQMEEHIVADVAWAACCYAAWTGDEAFLAGPGRDLVLETARWWAERIELHGAGRGHLRRVMGPDEYHYPVDDNAFTNVMARWNLRQAARLAAQCPSAAVEDRERRHWDDLADALVDGYDAATGIYEQFTGFHRLEPLIIADEAPTRPIAATLLLGDERVAGAQVVKQTDVLMLHHLVPDEVAPGSLRPNLDHYEPRTAHGSSLSPGIHAALLARTGQTERAVGLLRVAAGIDLDDLTQTTAAGVHLAAMGSTWQALALGFAGLRPDGSALRIRPRLPAAWESLTVPVRFRGARVRVEIAPGAVTVHADRPVSIRLEGGDPITIAPPAARFPLEPGSSGT